MKIGLYDYLKRYYNYYKPTYSSMEVWYRDLCVYNGCVTRIEIYVFDDGSYAIATEYLDISY